MKAFSTNNDPKSKFNCVLSLPFIGKQNKSKTSKLEKPKSEIIFLVRISWGFQEKNTVCAPGNFFLPKNALKKNFLNILKIIKPPITTNVLPFHLTYSTLVSWGYKFNEDEINLGSLNIGSIDANIFSKFTCLKKITLKNNKILRLYQDTFKNCKCLIYLDMSYNRLSQLHQGDFDGAENLQSLYLNNNMIENIDLNTFYNLKQIIDYKFENNPISNLFYLTLLNGVLSSTFIG